MTLLHHVFVVNINHEVLKRWGYKKRPEGEKKKVSYSMHIFNISAINRHFFFPRLHRQFFVDEIASKLTCS
jgi:hypothetical protein